MDILFDFEENKPPDYLEKLYEGNTGIIIKEMKAFVLERVRILSDEMEKYKNGKIRIHYFDRQIRFYGYPDELSLKLADCLSKDDLNYIRYKIWRILSPNEPIP